MIGNLPTSTTISRFSPWESEDDLDACMASVRRTLASGVFIGGPEVEAFEREAAAFLGVPGTLGVASGSDALTIALLAATDGLPGGDVLVPALTFVATAEAVVRAGFRPRFVDVSLDTFLLDLDDLATKIDHSTRAIVAVSLYGHPVDVSAIERVAPGIAVVEDACQSFGAEVAPGLRSGAAGRAGAFSFFPTKPLGGFGDGGLIASQDMDLLQLARAIGRHGCLERYLPFRLGLNSRLDALQAALLRYQLKRHQDRLARRETIATRYSIGLAGVHGLAVPAMHPGHAWHCYTVRVLDRPRRLIHDLLRSRGIETGILYPVPLHRMPHFDPFDRAPNAERACDQLLCLPIWAGMAEEQVEHVLASVRSAFDAHEEMSS